MKNIFKMLAILLALFCTMPVIANCTKQAGSMTGGACSIKELNNLEKINRKQEKFSLNLKHRRNLRPVKLNPEITTPCNVYCLFNMDLQKDILGK